MPMVSDEQRAFQLPADEGHRRPPAATARQRERLDGQPCRHLVLPAPDLDLSDGLERDGADRRGVRGGADEHPAGRSRGLQPRRGVDHIAHGRVVASGPQRTDEHLAGVHADAHPDGQVQVGRQLPDGSLHPQRCSHGALGIVLVGDRRAEEGHDGVAQDLVHSPTEAGHVLDEALEEAVDHRLDLLRIHALGALGEPDEVGEQDRDDATLLAPGHAKTLAAAGTEARSLGIGRRARRTDGHPPPSVRQGGLRTWAWPWMRLSDDGPMSSLPSSQVTSADGTPVAAAGAVDAVKTYGHGDNIVRALDGVTVAFADGAFSAIMGPSGSGKSTLMHCLAGLDSLTSGAVYIGETYLATLDDKALTRLRRDKVGFVFQAYNLLPTLTALENMTLPLALGGHEPDPAWLDTVVKTVGLGDRLSHRPSELSGGQQQRVAVARGRW